MSELYNTQKNLASDIAKFFKKVTTISKPQLKIIPYIVLGMIEAESVVTMDHMLCRDDFTILVFSMKK